MSNSAAPNPFADDHHMKPWETVRRGLLMLVSSPGGAGKTSLSRRLVADYKGMNLSISATTRPPRPGEVEGREYFFKTRPEFQALIDAGELLEWAEVNGHLYGTPKAPVMATLETGSDVMFDIDWQGARQVAEQAPDDSVRIYILPPSWSDLERRLHARAQDPEDEQDNENPHPAAPRPGAGGGVNPEGREIVFQSRHNQSLVWEAGNRCPKKGVRSRTVPGDAPV